MANRLHWISSVGLGLTGLTLVWLVSAELVSFDMALGFLFGWFACSTILYGVAFLHERRAR